MTTGRSLPADEAGMSLVEVIIYSSLVALTLVVLGGMFAAGLQTQAAARDRDSATGAAQVVGNSLQAGVRNASSVLVSAGLVKARVASGTGGWQCAAWALTADHQIVHTTDPALVASADYSAWTVLATGATGQLGGGAAFSGDSTRVDYALAFTSGSATVPVAGTIVPTAYGPGSPASCW